MNDTLHSLLARIPRTILTPRLRITLTAVEDSDALSDEVTGQSWDEMHHWVGWVNQRDNFTRDKYQAITAKNIRKFYDGVAFFGVARLRDTGELGPQVTLYNMDQAQKTGEAGYWTPSGLVGRGLTQEGMNAMLCLGYEHYGLKEIFANHTEGNAASGKILTNLGFAFTHIEENGAVRGNGQKLNALWYRHNGPAALPRLDVEYL